MGRKTIDANVRERVGRTPMFSWLADHRHLPPSLRDFHDQKRIFQAMYRWREPDGDERPDDALAPPGWMAAQVFVFDTFLRFMAAHGYTLQRSRAPGLEYLDLSETIREEDERQINELRATMKAATPG